MNILAVLVPPVKPSRFIHCPDRFNDVDDP